MINKKYKLEKNEGITLISLVITIILLIILAGISINLSLGENGLFNKAKYAKEKIQIRNAEEIIKLIVAENKIAENKNDQKGYLENNQLIEKIIKELIDEGYNIEEDKDTIICGKEQIRISDYLEYKNAYKINANAPKNSIVTLRFKEREIGKIIIDPETKSGNIDIYREIGETITAECKLGDEVIYEKTFQLQENTTINMYPCEENGDGKALYWYGMEFTNFESGAVKYGSNTSSVLGTFNKEDNNMNLYINDTSKTSWGGIGIYCKENLTNYNSVEIKVENIEYTGNPTNMYMISDVANNYHSNYRKSYYQENADSANVEKPSDGIKNIDIKGIEGEKYISILNHCPGGYPSNSTGTLNMDIVYIVLK